MRWLLLVLILLGTGVALAATREFPRLEEFERRSAESVSGGESDMSEDPLYDVPEDPGVLNGGNELDRSFLEGVLQTWVEKIQAAYAENQVLPSALTELTAAGSEDAGTAIIPEGVTRHPEDPWGRDIEYTVLTPTRFRLRSYGPDGDPGTNDDVEVEALAEEG